jgi:hypothetical protein
MDRRPPARRPCPGARASSRNHWRRDACAFEDKTRSRNPAIVATFAIVRCALLHFNAQTKSQNLNAFMEAAANHAAAFSLVMRSR